MTSSCPAVLIGGVSKTLILARHAEAEFDAITDAARRLTAKGQACAIKLGFELAKRVPAVDLAIVSAAARTQETYSLAAQSLPVAAYERSADLYNASVGELLASVAELAPELDTVLFVGHEPTISGAGSVLTSQPAPADALAFGIPTGTALVLAMPAGWQGPGDLLEVIYTH
ncbi:phosphohistidine phosphatase [Buchananella hordeovulneris]|nr:phosphohistidine phosphatase [Buchananella hordeovulneris]